MRVDLGSPDAVIVQVDGVAVVLADPNVDIGHLDAILLAAAAKVGHFQTTIPEQRASEQAV